MTAVLKESGESRHLDLRRSVVAGIFIFVVALWLGSALGLRAIISDQGARGSFGDSFGAINALFSGLAFAGVALAILLQRNELRLQREELELTRKELTRTAAAQEAAEYSIGQQAMVMKVTAHLNALTALVRMRAEEIDALRKNHPHPDAKVQEQLLDLQESRKWSINEIEGLIHGIFCAEDFPITGDKV